MNPLLLAAGALGVAEILRDPGRPDKRLSPTEKQQLGEAAPAALAALAGKVKRGRYREIDAKLVALEAALGRTFRRPGFIETALTHKSAARPVNNERIEFLGDRILNFVLALWMYQHYDHLTEHGLNQLFSAAKANDFLAARARKLQLGHFAYVGKSLTPATLSDHTLAGIYEAIVGALYLDGGLKTASDFIIRDITPHLGALVDSNFKTQLKDWAAQNGKDAIFWGAGKTGPEDAPLWRVKAMLVNPGEDPRKAGQVVGVGSGKDKLAAEQAAARMALQKLGLGKEPKLLTQARAEAAQAVSVVPALVAAAKVA